MPDDERSKNEEADEFLNDIERAGRNYVEDRQERYATIGAVSRLAAAVAEIAKAQALTTASMVELSKRIDSMEKNFERMALWMEGDIDANGKRIPGFIDHIGAWRTWQTQISTGVVTMTAGIVGLLGVAVIRLIIDLSASAVGVHVKTQ